MKKVILVSFLLFMSLGTIFAQLPISRGNFLANARSTRFGLSFSDELTTFDIGANGGFFVIDNLAIMGGLSFTTLSIYDESITSLGLNFGARYYFAQSAKGSFFTDGLWNIQKVENVDVSLGFTLDGGYAFFLKDNISIEPMTSLFLPFSNGDVTFSLGAGISIYF